MKPQPVNALRSALCTLRHAVNCAIRYAKRLAPIEHMNILDLDVKSRMLQDSHVPYIELEHKSMIV